MDYNINFTIQKLLDDTIDIYSHTDKTDALGEFMGYSIHPKYGCARVKQLVRQDDMLFESAVKALSFFGYKIYILKDGLELAIESVSQAMGYVTDILEMEQMTKTSLAKKLGVSYLAITRYFKEPKMRAGTLVRIFNALDYDVIAKNNDMGKVYKIGNKTYTDYVGEEILETFPIGNIEQINLSTFIDDFFRDRVVFDLKCKTRTDFLYDCFKKYWETYKNKRLQSLVRGKNHTCISKKVFEEECSRKIVKENEYYFGITLKELSI